MKTCLGLAVGFSALAAALMTEPAFSQSIGFSIQGGTPVYSRTVITGPGYGVSRFSTYSSPYGYPPVYAPVYPQAIGGYGYPYPSQPQTVIIAPSRKTVIINQNTDRSPGYGYYDRYSYPAYPSYPSPSQMCSGLRFGSPISRSYPADLYGRPCY